MDVYCDLPIVFDLIVSFAASVLVVDAQLLVERTADIENSRYEILCQWCLHHTTS
jgi:hypothetical protein